MNCLYARIIHTHTVCVCIYVCVCVVTVNLFLFCFLANFIWFECIREVLCPGIRTWPARICWPSLGCWPFGCLAVWLLANSSLWAMSNYQMNCAIIYFCLLIGCATNETQLQNRATRWAEIWLSDWLTDRLSDCRSDWSTEGQRTGRLIDCCNINVLSYDSVWLTLLVVSSHQFIFSLAWSEVNRRSPPQLLRLLALALAWASALSLVTSILAYNVANASGSSHHKEPFMQSAQAFNAGYLSLPLPPSLPLSLSVSLCSLCNSLALIKTKCSQRQHQTALRETG